MVVGKIMENFWLNFLLPYQSMYQDIYLLGISAISYWAVWNKQTTLREILEVERVKHIPLSWCKFGKYMRQMLGIWGLNHVKSPMICGGFSTHAFFLGWSSSFLRLHAINFTRNPKDCNFPMRKNISQTPDIDTWRLNPSATTKDIVSRCFSPIVTGWISINSLRFFPWVTHFSIAGVNP